MLVGGQRTEFHMNAILPIALYTTGVGLPIQFAYRPKATPFAGEACETKCSVVRMESCWKELQGRPVQQFCRNVRSHLHTCQPIKRLMQENIHIFAGFSIILQDSHSINAQT